ncbi:unnamed protein product [Cyclocybe aegerita]|uniref:Uncharacterized protein n=1 Tax=Cyclocybe aegerita TaxID=1973307 RepID=A0A8S0W6P8_CYCAE|nr:unnamed protein product [Cyclocybe aegerita]
MCSSTTAAASAAGSSPSPLPASPAARTNTHTELVSDCINHSSPQCCHCGWRGAHSPNCPFSCILASHLSRSAFALHLSRSLSHVPAFRLARLAFKFLKPKFPHILHSIYASNASLALALASTRLPRLNLSPSRLFHSPPTLHILRPFHNPSASTFTLHPHLYHFAFPFSTWARSCLVPASPSSTFHFPHLFMHPPSPSPHVASESRLYHLPSPRTTKFIEDPSNLNTDLTHTPSITPFVIGVVIALSSCPFASSVS